MDLFSPLVEEGRLHPLFKKIVSETAYQPTTSIINQWADGLLGRKQEANKFIKEFQTTFNSSLWELYLNKAFIELGYEIDYSKESPDFHLIHSSGRRVNVEAVTSNNKDNICAEYYNNTSFHDAIGRSNEDFLDQSTIKLIGKIKDKHELFIGAGCKKYPYSSLEHVKGNPFVIAIAPFDNHMSYAQNNMAINRVLYGIDPPSADGSQKNIDHIINTNNQRIDLGIFTNDTYKNVSAVIFSTTGMFGKAVVQTDFKGMVRATRYRQLSVDTFLNTEGKHSLGHTYIKIDSEHDLFRIRFYDGANVCGADMHFYASSKHTESHLDGLHIYYNPYAEFPLNKDLFAASEITQNDYDTQSKRMICNHNDGSLVSRQTFTIV
ncbi:hypothetical protein [Halopseudomonas bauzanensis]|uniref:hypothetical protein n=1 Tax=Halopseudomonas bauzanensis TaxID=653930 RepID=UPI002555CA39|nr:hypothetical protein [Halopseudomonas bauzanensis]